MTSKSPVHSAKRMMLIGYSGIIIGGVVFIALAIASGQYILGSAVGWGCGFSTTIYSSGKRAIKSLEEAANFGADSPESKSA